MSIYLFSCQPTPYQKTANCKKYEAELGWYGLMSPSGKVITPPRYCDNTAIGYDLYLCKTDDIRGEVLNGKGVRLGNLITVDRKNTRTLYKYKGW